MNITSCGGTPNRPCVHEGWIRLARHPWVERRCQRLPKSGLRSVDLWPWRRSRRWYLLVVGTPIAWWLARSRSAWKEVVATVVALPLVLPPTVLGFYLLVALGPQARRMDRQFVRRPLAGIQLRRPGDRVGAVFDAIRLCSRSAMRSRRWVTTARWKLPQRPCLTVGHVLVGRRTAGPARLFTGTVLGSPIPSVSSAWC